MTLPYGILPTADKLVYRVPSDRAAVQPWTVDLEQFGGWGACNCPDYRMPRSGKPSKVQRMRDGERNPSAWCKHIQRAHVAHSVVLNQCIIEAMPKASRFQGEWRGEA